MLVWACGFNLDEKFSLLLKISNQKIEFNHKNKFTGGVSKSNTSRPRIIMNLAQ